MMMNTINVITVVIMAAILNLTDGTTIVSFLNSNDGYFLQSWNRNITQYKDGGTFSDNPLAEGRQLVNTQLGNGIETFTLSAKTSSHDRMSELEHDLFNLLVQSDNFWLSKNNAPVWIEAKSTNETNTRYAIVKSWRIPELPSQLQQPYLQPGCEAVLDSFSLIVERGQWLSRPPGESSCVNIDNRIDWSWQRDQWAQNTTLPTGQTYYLMETSAGDIFAGGTGEILVTQNNGGSWSVSSGTPSGTVDFLFEISNGYLFAGDLGGGGRLLRSIDGGAIWNIVSVAVGGPRDMTETSAGTLLVADKNGIYRSTDYGASWTLIDSSSEQITIDLINVDGDDFLYAGRDLGAGVVVIKRSIDDGVSWSELTTFYLSGSKSLNQSAKLDIGQGAILYVVNGGTTGELWIWQPETNKSAMVFSAVNTTFANPFVIGNEVYVGATNTSSVTSQYLYSNDTGRNYQIIDVGITTNMPVNSNMVIKDSDGRLFAAGNGEIWIVDLAKTTTIGRVKTCDNEIYLSNSSSGINLTHIKLYDSSVAAFTDIYPSTLPQLLFPSPIGNGDIIYFGIDQTRVSPSAIIPIYSLVFDLSQGMFSSGGSFTSVWEYYNGAWVTLPTQDYTAVTQPLERTNVNSLSGGAPTDRTVVTIDSVAASWIRLRITSLSGAITVPEQQTDQVYMAFLPYFNIDSSEIIGNLNALLRLRVFNQSDKDGSGAATLDGLSNRSIVSIRQKDRGDTFDPFINVSDTQQNQNISITTGTNCSFSSDVTTPTGRTVLYNPAGVEAMADRAIIALSGSAASDYQGSYRVFVVVTQSGGSLNDFSVRLKISGGPMRQNFLSDTKKLETVSPYEVIDLGNIKIDTPNDFLFNNIVLTIQASSASGTPNLDIHELVLMPNDEYIVDTVDLIDDSNSALQVETYQEISGLSQVSFRDGTSALIKNYADISLASWHPVAGGKFSAKPNTDLRVYIFSMSLNASGFYVANPWIFNSVQLAKNQRYYAARGDS